MSELEAYKDYMKRLEGGIVHTASAVDEGDMVIPYLIIKMPNGKAYQVDILSDPEGNGGGHPDIIERIWDA